MMQYELLMHSNCLCLRYSVDLVVDQHAALNWYRANVQLEQFGDTKPRPAPLLRCPVMGIWSCGDQGVLEAQMKASARFYTGHTTLPEHQQSLLQNNVLCSWPPAVPEENVPLT